jgi:integrator complex subunit 6
MFSLVYIYAIHSLTHTHHAHTHTSTPQPSRDANPVLLFNTTDLPPLLVENFPFDKYELEPSPLTQYILGRRNPNICWQVR